MTMSLRRAARGKFQPAFSPESASGHDRIPGDSTANPPNPYPAEAPLLTCRSDEVHAGGAPLSEVSLKYEYGLRCSAAWPTLVPGSNVHRKSPRIFGD